MERTLGGRALDQERRIANSGRDYEEQDLKMELLTELIMNGLTGRPGQEGEGVPRFDPERAPWLVYIAKGMKWKQSDFIRRERDGVPELTHGERQRIREADPDRRDEVRRAVYRGISALSLDVPMGEEEATLGDMVQDPEGLKTLEPGWRRTVCSPPWPVSWRPRCSCSSRSGAGRSGKTWSLPITSCFLPIM